jgi:steroid 5-alpha reductase family enzyme
MIFGPAFAVLAAMVLVMTGAWAFGLSRRNGGWTDVFWTFGSGITLAAAALWPIGPNAEPAARQWLVAALVAAWAVRLGGYLAPRVATHPEDPRYAAFRRAWGADYARNMLWVSLPQAPATALLALSVLVAAEAPGPLGGRDAIGVLVFLVGVGGEALADAQMKRFKADAGNRGKVCDVGLWGWSRHPNYFFEWLVWLAYPVIGLDPGRPAAWLSFAAPLVMFVLLTRVSGIPPLEESQLKSKGEAYAAYQRRVSAFFPLPPHRAPEVPTSP